MKPLLIVVSAPSGSGKTTLCDRLLREREDIVYSVSCTTRAPRGREVDGVAYHFLSEPQFRERLEHGEFLEHAEVHGHLYGTLRSTVEAAMAAGHSVLMDIDVQGAAQVRSRVREAPRGNPLRAGFLDVFIEPPSLEELRRRLTERAEDSAETIEKRLKTAEKELAGRDAFRVRIVNDDLDRAYREFKAGIEAEGGD